MVPVEILKALISSILATWPTYLNLLNHPDNIKWTVHTINFRNVELSPLLILIPLGPKIRLKILFSNTLSLDSSLNERDHASQPYSTTCNIIVLYILIFKFLERNQDDNSD
jgi:hypothetical protein